MIALALVPHVLLVAFLAVMLAAFLTTAIEYRHEDGETAAIMVAVSALAGWALLALIGAT